MEPVIGPARLNHENIGAPNERVAFVFDVTLAAPDGTVFGAAFDLAEGDTLEDAGRKHDVAVAAVKAAIAKHTAAASEGSAS